MAIRFLDPEGPAQPKAKVRFLDEAPSAPAQDQPGGGVFGSLLARSVGLPAKVNKKRAVEAGLDAMPTAGSVIGGLVGAPAAPVTFGASSIGGAALGGAGGEAYKQIGKRALGMSAPSSSMEAAKKIGVTGAREGAYEAAGLGVAQSLPYVAKGLKKAGGFIADSMPGIKRGAGWLAAEFPEITKKGYASAERIEAFGKGLMDKLTGYQSKTKEAFAKTAKTIDDLEGAARIPTKELASDFLAFRKEYGVGKKGIQKLDVRTQKTFEDIEKEFADEMQGKEAFSLQDMLGLRQRVKREVDFAGTEAGKGLDAAALKNLYNSVDRRIANDEVYKTFKSMDAEYEDMIATTKDLKTAFGLPASEIADLSLAERKALEAKIMQSLSKGELEEDAISLIDRKLGAKESAMEAKKMAVSKQFDKWLPNTFVGKGALPIAATAALTGNPLAAAGIIGGSIIASPGSTGAMLRGGKAVLGAARKAASGVAPAIKIGADGMRKKDAKKKR